MNIFSYSEISNFMIVPYNRIVPEVKLLFNSLINNALKKLKIYHYYQNEISVFKTETSFQKIL